MTREPVGVLFVCLGNICRSPLAEAIFVHRAQESGALDQFIVDSCGMGHWHVGEPPDPRARAVARRHGIPMNSRARQFDPKSDPERFPWIIAMDQSNKRALLDAGTPGAAVHLMRSFDPDVAANEGFDLDVPDPYYGGDEGFTHVLQMLDRSVHGLLRTLRDQARP